MNTRATGAVTLAILACCARVIVFPLLPSQVQFTTVVMFSTEIRKVVSLVTVTHTPHLSVAVGAVKLVTSHSAMISYKVKAFTIGFSLFTTVTSSLQISSVTVIFSITFFTRHCSYSNRKAASIE
jgi:hypothetical protein